MHTTWTKLRKHPETVLLMKPDLDQYYAIVKSELIHFFCTCTCMPHDMACTHMHAKMLTRMLQGFRLSSEIDFDYDVTIFLDVCPFTRKIEVLRLAILAENFRRQLAITPPVHSPPVLRHGRDRCRLVTRAG